MTIPRSERLRIAQDENKQWQEIYGDREAAELEILELQPLCIDVRKLSN